MVPLKTCSATRAGELLREGAVMIDIREPHEFAGGHIGGARNVPNSAVKEGKATGIAGRVVVFCCASGNRTMLNAEKLAALVSGQGYILEGGLSAWRNAGLPVDGSGN